MFGGLKNKLAGFINSLVKKEEQKPAEQQATQIPIPAAQPPVSEHQPKSTAPAAHEIKPQTIEEEIQAIEQEVKEEVKKQEIKEHEAKKEEVKEHEVKKEEIKEQEVKKQELRPSPPIEVKPLSKPAELKPIEPRKLIAQTPAPTITPVHEPTPATTAKPYFELKHEEKKLEPKIGLVKKIASFFSDSVTISENEVTPLLEDLRLALLESDVTLDTTEYLLADLQKRLVGKKIAKNTLRESVQAEVENALTDLFVENDFDLQKAIESKKALKEPLPFIILFLGPNGAGKTTTIAKLARRIREAGNSVVLAASDSFRAGAIQQLEHHGNALGVKVIKQAYGADPTAVAFDAIKHAKANNVDVVLIDTAGRQDTNYNLVKEMEKMNRVLKPDLRIFVGEAIAGHALVEQVKTFSEKIGVDALVLTKLDCDSKGGTAFSVAFEAKKPILFIGVGQEYADLREFDKNWLAKNVVAA